VALAQLLAIVLIIFFLNVEEKEQALEDVKTKFHQKRLCNRSEILNGEWEGVRLDKAPYNPYNITNIKNRVGMWCGNPSDYKMPWLSYEWTIANENPPCSFEMWSKDRFCNVGEKLKIAQNFTETIALVGDSLTWEHYMALGYSLGAKIDKDGQFISRRGRKSIDARTCDGDVKIMYWRSDYLEFLPNVLALHPTTVIINTGAHYVRTDSDFMKRMNSTIEQLRNWTQTCDLNQQSCLIIVRTTVPGHPHCSEFPAPVNDIQKIEDIIANKSNYNAKELTYKWFNFKRRNNIMLEMFEKSNLSYSVIDAYEINIRRPDHHNSNGVGYFDCLHSCIPGKPDIYNRLLLHFLRKKLRLLNSEL